MVSDVAITYLGYVNRDTGIVEETGLRPAWAAEAFANEYDDVAQSIKRVTSSPFIPHTDQVRGFVFNVATGVLEEVTG